MRSVEKTLGRNGIRDCILGGSIPQNGGGIWRAGENWAGFFRKFGGERGECDKIREFTLFIERKAEKEFPQCR